MPKFRTFNEQEQQCWRDWAEHRMMLPRSEFSTRQHIQQWAYELGIQPGTYLYQRTEGQGYQTRPWNDQIEIRFQNPEDLALIKISGHDDQT